MTDDARAASPRVLGVYLGHDMGACLLAGGRLVTMIEEERLNRFKHGRPNSVAGLWSAFAGKFGYFPWASVSYCLEANGLGLDDVDLVMVGDDLWGADARETIHTIVPTRDRDKVVFAVEPAGAVHHYHHALSAFFASPFDRAAVLVIDADGSSNANGYEAESGYLFHDRRGRHEVVFKNRYRSSGIPRDGVGWMYEQISRLLGFYDETIFLADAGKTMGLAGWGRPRPELAHAWIDHDGFTLDFAGFRTWLTESTYDTRILENPVGLARRSPLSRLAADVSHKAQVELERAVLHLATCLYEATGVGDLCLAGGVVLNSVANGLLVRHGPFGRVFVQPAANDGGQAIGLAYHGHLLLGGTGAMSVRRSGGRDLRGFPSIKPISHAYGGRRYPRHEIRDLLDRAGVPYGTLPESGVAKDAAAELSASQFVGWVQGGSEFGPRALGHRSILADPRGREAKDRLNARVKFREAFRPFAPSVLKELANEVFDLAVESPYMLLVAPVREGWRERVPAIVHADGTARIQTVDRETEPLFYALIEQFGQATGVPLVLNTSFNLRGMPIVESPADALQCFLYTELDCLYLDSFKLSQPPPSMLVPELAPGAEVLHRPAAHGRADGVLAIQGRGSGQKVELEASDATVALLACLDGKRSLADAHRSVAGEGGREIPIDAALAAVKTLLRAGALRLTVGDLRFGGGWNDRPWWQNHDR